MNTHKLKLESEIYNIVKSDNGCEIHFDYDLGYSGPLPTDKYHSVNAITYNPITKESFLMCKCNGLSQIEALECVLSYINTHRVTNYSHTIIWANKIDKMNNTSYFYGKDAMEALEKFYHGKNRDEYMVYSIKLNPLS